MAPALSSRRSRTLIALAVASFAGITLAYFLAPADRLVRAWLADLSWTWTALLATVACALAARHVVERHERHAWGWLTAACGAFFAAQLVWNRYELVLRVQPPYPSLADAGYLVTYVFMGIAVMLLWRGRPHRRIDVEVSLDGLLVTFTLAALAYEFVVEPILESGGTGWQIATSIAWAVGALAVLWLTLMQMLYRGRFPRPAAALVLAAVAVLSATNIVYAVAALDSSFVSGGPLDLGWDAALSIITVGAAVAWDDTVPGATAPISAQRADPRVATMVIGLGGVMMLAVVGALHADPQLDIAIMTFFGLCIVAARVLYSLRTDRRYAQMLEREVASQTRTLMDSLSATAAAERHLRMVMEAVPDAIMVLDRDGLAVDLNGAARERLALPHGTGVGRSIFEFLEPEAVRLTRENLNAAFEGAVRRFEIPFERADRTRGISSVLCAPVREAGVVTRVLSLARDVTDLRRAETQLQQAEKLAAMGQLVSGVAHEINNPAAIISGFAQTMMLDEMKPEQLDMMKMIFDEATRIGRITQNLLAFARAGGRERTLVDVNDIVRRTFALRSYHLSTLNIGASLELDPAKPKVWGNGSELQQMLLNLIINAEQALVTVSGARTLVLRTASSENDVTITCEDSGPGIPAEIRERIFDPFFTTKAEGVGTGLGLSICYGIVHDHGGRLTVESDTRGGAAFIATLPRDPRTQARVSTEIPREAVPRGAAPLSILLVDDEPGLRKAVARFLNRRGMQCRAVGDGAEALEVLRLHEFDVIISDVRMPGMSGREFLDGLRANHPDHVPRLIFSTGDTFARDTADLLKESGVPSLEKPFDFGKLEGLVREIASRVTH